MRAPRAVLADKGMSIAADMVIPARQIKVERTLFLQRTKLSEC